MSSLASDLCNAVFIAILHSIWQGALLALSFAYFSRRIRSAQSIYCLAITLFAAAPALFLLTFMAAYSSAHDAVGMAAHLHDQPPALSIYFAIAWCIGAALVGGRFFFGWVWLHAFILRRAQNVPAHIESLFDCTKQALNAQQRVLVRASSLIRSPMVTGVIRPVVLLPVYMLSGVSLDALRTVFVHELLHLRRLDHWAVLVQAVGETLLFYHPAVRWLSAETRRIREFRCDDDSVALLGDKFKYAHALVALEQSRHDDAIPALMMNGGDLMDRVERILDQRTMFRSSKLNFSGLATFLCVALFAYSLSNGDEADKDGANSENYSHTLSIRWLPPSVAQWSTQIERAAARHDVPANVLALMLFRESGGDAKAVSNAGARGLMQVMPRTGQLIAERRGIEGFENEQLFEPEINIDFGAWYLSEQLARFSEFDEDPIALAVSAYNAGPGAVAAYIGEGRELPDETLRYRDMVLALMAEKDDATSSTIENYMSKIRQRLPAFTAPVQGRVSSPYGFDGGERGTHNGVDIAASLGTPVIAPIGGRITAVGEDAKRGKFVSVRHAEGIDSHYFHLNDVAVTEGSKIEAGDALGEVGNTGLSNGPHLHFEIREFGRPVSPALYGFASG